MTSTSKLPFEEHLKPTIEYFSALTEEGVALYQRHEPRGDVFLDLTIENIRFAALIATDGPYISAEKLYSGVSLGVSAISFVNSDFERKVGWWVCKYWNQPRIDVNALTPAGRRTLAVQFGLLMQGPPDVGPFVSEHSEAMAFYASPAFEALRRWATAHPRKIKRFGPNSYLGEWAQYAQVRV